MKTDIAKLPKSEIELKIEVPVQEWQEFLDEAAAELSADLKIEGFRPGHAPAKLVEEKIGMARILEEAAEHCVHKCYVRAILDNNIEAIGKPEISVTKIAKDNPFEFKARVAVMPQVVLPDYKKIASDLKKDKKQVSVSEEEIIKSIDWIKKSRTKYVTVPRACAIGDRIEIDFEGECKGQKLPELFSQNQPAILGRGYFLPGFEENLLGMKEGEEKKFNLVFPENFEHRHLAGKTVDFKAKMNLVQEGQVPVLNDEFAQGLGKFENLEALKQSMKEGLLAEKQEQEKDRWRTALIEKIVAESKMEIPDVLIEGEKTKIKEEAKAKLEQAGLSYEQYLERFKESEADLEKEFFEQAKKRVRGFLILREITKQEKIEVPEEEVAEETNRALVHFKNHSQAQADIDSERLKEYAKEVLKNEKTFQLLENC